MAACGKSINLFLMDGDASGRIKCTLANWTGIAYKIPRTELDKCKERDDLKQRGVYFLFGTSDETGKGVVYIGQAGAKKNGEGILNRLTEHKRNPEKDYWTEAIVFTTSNNSFGPTEISYLENRFCNLAVAAKRYDVKNGNDPTPGNITEEKKSEMEEFCPWDVINQCDLLRVSEEAQMELHWENSSSNAVVKDILRDATEATKEDIEALISGVAVEKEIIPELTYADLDSEDAAVRQTYLWSILYSTGYLTDAARPDGRNHKLVIPNKEIQKIYEDRIRFWFRENVTSDLKRWERFCGQRTAGR